MKTAIGIRSFMKSLEAAGGSSKHIDDGMSIASFALVVAQPDINAMPSRIRAA
jgi:hypothetical protein